MSKSGEIEVASDNEPSAGERLQQAREALKLSIDDVAERICIGSSKVSALENNAIHEVGAPVFAAGYIRAYARIVGLSADELVASYESLEQLNESSVTPASGHVPKKIGRLKNELPANFSLANGNRWGSLLRWLGIIIILLLIVAAAFWLFKSGKLVSAETDDASTELVPFSEQSSLANEADDAELLAIPGQSTIAPVDTEESASLSIPLPIQPDNEASMLVDELAAQTLGESDVSAPLNELSLHFQDDSWVEVHDARKERLLHQLARAGQVHTLRGVTPFSLVLGYVPGVSILLNGESVDLSHYQGRRLVHLTIGETVNVN